MHKLVLGGAKCYILSYIDPHDVKCVRSRNFLLKRPHHKRYRMLTSHNVSQSVHNHVYF